MTTYNLIVERPSNLLSIELRREISEAELAAIRTVLRIHDHDDESPCYCLWQFAAKATLEDVWADAQRRARLADPDRGSVEWMRRQPGYLPPILTRDSPEVLEAKWRAGITDPPAFRQPGETVNGLYKVIAAEKPTTPPGDDPDHSMMIANDTVD